MNPDSTHRLKLVAAALAVVVSIPLFAATPAKRRSVGPLPDATLTGTVVDDATGAPVVAADVTYADRTTTTDTQGKFTLVVPGGRPTTLSVRRSGYDPATANVTPGGTSSVTIRVKGRATVRVRTTNNTTYNLDYESAQFAYTVPFSGYAKSDAGNFCKPDGSEYKPDKSLIARVVGPATETTFSACCKIGPVRTAQLELKDGSKTQVYFVDSCFGFQVNFLGRDHVSGQFVYLDFKDVAEIVFP